MVGGVGCLTGLKLEGAERMRDVLEGVHKAVGVVVSRVDAPLVSGAVVLFVHDAVCHVVPHVWVLGHEVTLEPQCRLTLCETSIAHLEKEFEVLLRCAHVPAFIEGFLLRESQVRVLCNLVVIVLERITLRGDTFCGKKAHVGLIASDELAGEVKEIVKVVRGVGDGEWCVSHPPDVIDDGIDVLLLLSLGVGVIETQVAVASVGFCGAEVDRHGLCMADVQVTVGLRREAQSVLAAGDLEVLSKDLIAVHIVVSSAMVILWVAQNSAHGLLNTRTALAIILCCRCCCSFVGFSFAALLVGSVFGLLGLRSLGGFLFLSLLLTLSESLSEDLLKSSGRVVAELCGFLLKEGVATSLELRCCSNLLIRGRLARASRQRRVRLYQCIVHARHSQPRV
mmetsp:Transcript_16345/g.31744  ORF Transcript_16345/g.31744 Transcript_16345/m.31744 type:complete len:395 (+) Transcript_16345:1248-2432(+)